jgi:hypothetical protein
MTGVDQPGGDQLQRFEALGRRLDPLMMGLLVLVVSWLAGSPPRAATLGGLAAAVGWAFETTRKVAGWPVALAVVLPYALTALIVGWTL